MHMHTHWNSSESLHSHHLAKRMAGQDFSGTRCPYLWDHTKRFIEISAKVATTVFKGVLGKHHDVNKLLDCIVER